MGKRWKLFLLSGLTSCWCSCSSRHASTGQPHPSDAAPAANASDDAPRSATAPVVGSARAEGFKITTSLVGAGGVRRATQPILMRVRMENASAGPLRFLHRTPERDFEFLVFAEDGKPAPPTAYGRDVQAQRESGLDYGRGSGHLNPGQAVDVVLQVDRIHDMTRAGTYRIQALRHVPRQGAPERIELFRPSGRLISDAAEVTVIDPPMRHGSILPEGAGHGRSGSN